MMTYPASQPRHAYTGADWQPSGQFAGRYPEAWQTHSAPEARQTHPAAEVPRPPRQRRTERQPGPWPQHPPAVSPPQSPTWPPPTAPWPDTPPAHPNLYPGWAQPSGDYSGSHPANGHGAVHVDLDTVEPDSTHEHAGTDSGTNEDNTQLELQRVIADPVKLLDPMFLTLAGGRLVRATSGHAFFAQEHLGRDALEPGPHALLLLSGRPRERGTADVIAAARLFHVGEADDMPTMLDGMSQVVTAKVATAHHDRQLLAYLTDAERTDLARHVLQHRWNPDTDVFPYLQAVQQGLLWDPRMPQLGITATSDDELSEDTQYVGVAVTTLDTEDATWESIKHRYAGATDPIKGLPLTPAHVPAHAWALLEGDTALHVHRAPALALGDKTHEVTANRPLGDSMTSRGRLRLDRNLLHTPPSVFQTTNLWRHLHGLHTALRSAFNYGVLR